MRRLVTATAAGNQSDLAVGGGHGQHVVPHEHRMTGKSDQAGVNGGESLDHLLDDRSRPVDQFLHRRQASSPSTTPRLGTLAAILTERKGVGAKKDASDRAESARDRLGFS